MLKGTKTNHCTDATFMVCVSCVPQVSYGLINICISGSEEAGEKLLTMLELGSSKPWKEVMEVMTGGSEIDTAAYREYFLPLEKWLQEENEKNGVTVGWKVKDLEDVCAP